MSSMMYKSEDEYEMLIAFIIARRTDSQNHKHAKQEWKANAEKQVSVWVRELNERISGQD